MQTNAQSVVLRGYVSGRGHDWKAICLDLDIAAQGESMWEAKRILSEMVHDYLDFTHGLPEAERKRLLRRKAPWTVRMGKHLKYTLSTLFERPSDGDRLSFVLHGDDESKSCPI